MASLIFQMFKKLQKTKWFSKSEVKKLVDISTEISIDIILEIKNINCNYNLQKNEIRVFLLVYFFAGDI